MLINRIGLLYAQSLGLQESQNHELCESAIAYVHHNVSKYHSQPTLTLTVVESTISFISGNVSVSIGCHPQREHDNFHQVGIRNDNIFVVSKKTNEFKLHENSIPQIQAQHLIVLLIFRILT